jgi:hypothetical protein
MMKHLLAICVTSLMSVSCFATTPSYSGSCPPAASTNSPQFCSTFKTSAQCHCVDAGLPKALCQDMDTIYSRMISIFGSIQKACAYQTNTTPQICIDDWNCYRQGGKDSAGRLCSSTGKKC